MAMTTEEMRSGIETLCGKDSEMKEIHSYLDRVVDWPVNEKFQLMILIDELKKRMKDEVAHFTFRKKDGSIRQAYGTRVSEVIVRYEGALLPPQNQRQQQRSGGTFPYFDIERQAWRCFKVETLMDIDRGYTI